MARTDRVRGRQPNQKYGESPKKESETTMSETDSAANYFDLVCNQRAQRDLKPDPVPQAIIEKILEAGTHAPSAGNCQPWRFVVVQDPAVRRKISDGARAAWEGFARDMTKDTSAPGFKSVDQWAMGGLAEVPVIIVLCGDTQVLPLEQMGSSIFPAAQNILLAANALGLASLMSNLPLYAPNGTLAKVLGLPDHIVPLATLPIGYPASKLGKPRRKPITEVTSRDRFGAEW
ncbi:MAG: nitroreductase family protein [Deltaproteobacteria bacterium]|nr:nitroreductase family protein [Deltaproteobacteria bacterium]